MKKKILLMLSIMAALVCVFAISVGAAVTIYDDAPKKTVLEMNNDEYVVFSDGFSCPSYYILPDQAKLEKTDYSYINEKTGKTYTDADVVEMHVPTGITDMNKRFGAWKIFTNCTVVGIPSTASPKDQFGNQSIVTKVYLADEHTSIPEWAFSASSTLEEIIISENSKLEVIYGGAFSGCNSLKYLYLPKGFKHFDNSNGNEPFKNFNPTHENFGFINSPNETTIPEVYFFPSTFEYTEGFLWGSKLKNYAIVLPETVTAITGKYDIDGTSVTCVVLLSDRVTEVNLWNTTNGSKIYLPNMSSSDMNGDYFVQNASSVASSVSGGILSHTIRRGGRQYYYFGVDQKCTYTTWSNSMNRGGLNPFQDIAASDHLNAYKEVTEVSCDNPRTETVSCVCGYLKSTKSEGDALGHNHTIFVDLVYTSFATDGYYSYKCERCDDLDNSKKAPALFTCLGYSVTEFGKCGIVLGYSANYDAIADYANATGKTVKYGVFAVSKDNLGASDIFASDGTVTKGVIVADVSMYNFNSFEVKVSGFTDEYKDSKLAMGAYVETTKDGVTEYSYMQSAEGELAGKYYFVSYNDIAGNPS